METPFLESIHPLLIATLYGLVTFTSILPILILLGSMRTVYVSFAGSIWLARLKLALLDVADLSVELSGLRSFTVVLPITLFVSRTVTC